MKRKLKEIFSSFGKREQSDKGIFYGDNGIFVKKEVSENHKGFKEIPIMEGYDFSKRMNQKYKATKIKNLSRPSRIHAEFITIGFSYNDKPPKVKNILLDIAQKTEGVLADPPPAPLTMSYDDFYITYGLKFYIKDFEDQILLKDRLMTQIYEAAEKHNLTIPFPITELKILKDGSVNQEDK